MTKMRAETLLVMAQYNHEPSECGEHTLCGLAPEYVNTVTGHAIQISLRCDCGECAPTNCRTCLALITPAKAN